MLVLVHVVLIEGKRWVQPGLVRHPVAPRMEIGARSFVSRLTLQKLVSVSGNDLSVGLISKRPKKARPNIPASLVFCPSKTSEEMALEKEKARQAKKWASCRPTAVDALGACSRSIR